MKYFTIPELKYMVGQREVHAQIKALPSTIVEKSVETYVQKWGGTFNSLTSCEISIDENGMPLNLSGLVKHSAWRPNIVPDLLLEDLDIKLLIEINSATAGEKVWAEIPPSLESGFFWKLTYYPENNQNSPYFRTGTYLLTTGLYGGSGIKVKDEGTPYSTHPFGYRWRVVVQTKNQPNRQINIDAFIKAIVSNCIISPFSPGYSRLTNYYSNPVSSPVTGKAVYDFLMDDLRLPDLLVARKASFGGDPHMEPADGVEFRTKEGSLRSDYFAFYSSREYLQFKITSTLNRFATTSDPNGDPKKIPDCVGDNQSLGVKATVNIPELRWEAKKPNAADFDPAITGHANPDAAVSYPIPAIWNKSDWGNKTIRIEQTGRMKIAPYLIGDTGGNFTTHTFTKYDAYSQRNLRQTYKALFDDSDLVPKKIIEYMIKDIIGDKIAVRSTGFTPPASVGTTYNAGTDFNSPLSEVVETYGIPFNSSPDPIALKSYVDKVWSSILKGIYDHKNASVLDHPDGSVTTIKIADANVTTRKLATNAVTTEKIADGNITNLKLVDGAVTLSKIKDGNVTTEKITDNAVTLSKIANLNVTTDKLANSAVTTTKIANLSITTDKLADHSVTAAKLAFTLDLSAAAYTVYVKTPAL